MGNFCCSPQSLSLQYHLRQFNFELVFGQLSLDFLQQLLCLLLGFCRKTFDAETPQTICVAAFSNPYTQLQFCLDRNRYRHFHPPEYLGVPGCGELCHPQFVQLLHSHFCCHCSLDTSRYSKCSGRSGLR